jgi:YD repeat-containing protein
MKQFRYIRFILLLVVTPFFSWCQTAPNVSDYSKIIDVLPPSPNAASLGKYGGMDLNLASGMANINVPIFEYTSRNLKVPISLSYASNGFKVDELPGRVGVGWSLNAGGVVTRTVYGAIDEQAQRLSVPSDFPARSRALIDFMENASNQDAYASFDVQPDIFSFNFNGYSGRFILDSNYNPILLSYSNLKIERDFVDTLWTFKITTADGVQYLFGGNSAMETTSKSQTGCGKIYPNTAATAWYLQEIIHPNNDTITFKYLPNVINYKTGISESVFGRITSQVPAPCSGYNVASPNLGNTSCVSLLRTGSILLDEINSTGGVKVKFNYINRTDGDDKLLSSIDVYRPEQATVFKSYSFNYQYSHSTSFQNSFTNSDTSLNYRPFLIGFTEKNPIIGPTKNYSFSYNDINSLPPRLSYAQDDYGYFNGKNNSTLIPHPTDPSWQSFLPTATANRDEDPIYAQKGLISSIIYPTGGQDSLIYESNQVYKNVPIYPPQTSINASSTNTILGSSTIVYSGSAIIGFAQKQRLIGGCSFNGTSGQDATHDKGTIDLIDVTAGATIYSQVLIYGQNLDTYISLLAGHTYEIRSTAFGNVTIGATLYYMAGNITYQYMNVNTGGIRVQKIISTDKVTNATNIKKYLYSSLSTPGISSGGPVYTPLYEKILPDYIPCSSGTKIDPNSSLINCDVTEFDFYSMYSNSQNNIYVYPSSPISYSSVIESFGENFENGGIEHQFTVSPDVSAVQLVGNGIMFNSPLSSYAWQNAREIYQQVFKMQGGNYIPVKKIFTHYKEDIRVDSEYKAYIGDKKYSPTCINYTNPSDIEINAFDLYTFSHFRKWVYVDTTRIWTYDSNGQNYLEQLNVTDYSNVAHALPTKETSYLSNGVTNIVTNSYPQDITLTGSEETARQALVANHITGAVLQQQVSKNGNQIFNLKTGYNIFPNGLVLPQTRSVQLYSNPFDERIRVYNYDKYGKILEQSKNMDARQSYIWDNINNSPIAAAVNASFTEIAYTSFESDAHGNWTYSGLPIADINCPTGNMYYSLVNGAITASGLTNTKAYIVSYWSKNGPAIVNTSPGIAGAIRNGWTYYEHSMPIGTTSISLSNNTNTLIDELRLYPAGSQMTTYTFNSLLGMTSQCDVNNRITYYEYDSLGRLSLMRDQDRNIVKKICYNYIGQAEDCGVNTTPLWQNTSTPIRCKKNSSNQNTGEQEQEQKDINNYSLTYNQLRWVVVGTNLTACPVAITIYARIEYTSWYYDVGISTATVLIKFYSDNACTVPISVNNLSVNYQIVKTLCGSSSTTTNYNISCTGTQVSLGTQTISYDDGTGKVGHCYNNAFQVTSGTGYTQK